MKVTLSTKISAEKQKQIVQLITDQLFDGQLVTETIDIRSGDSTTVTGTVDEDASSVLLIILDVLAE